MRQHRLWTIALIACALAWPTLASAQDEAKPTFEVDAFDWKVSPETVRAKLDGARTDHYGTYDRVSRRVTLHDEPWTQFFVFRDDKLIAQGYERVEKPKRHRFGTISDIVSYDNKYWVVDALKAKYGQPAFEDKRTKAKYSKELGDAALRAKRAVEWDMLGERFRWEPDGGTVRYTVQYSLDNLRTHRVVNVSPQSWSHYFDFQIAQAFRDAGIQRIRRFRRHAKKWVVATFSPSGEVTISKYAVASDAEPVAPRRTEYTRDNCRVSGRKCEVTYKFYGGHLYQVDIDFSESGNFPRRGHHEEIGERYYSHFMTVDQKLGGFLGKPAASTRLDDLDNGRNKRRAQNLVQGLEAFWSVWYDVGQDVLVRHTITGESHGTGYTLDHKVTIRFHSVARAMAEHDAWKAETAKINAK